MALVLGNDLAGRSVTLPVEPSEKISIAGVSGSGKSFLAYRLCEEFVLAGQKVGILDPVGIAWGLRSGFDGDPAKGFPIRIFGGARADLQLQQPKKAAEEFIAGVEPAIFDLSMTSYETMHWWCAEFCNRIGELGSTIRQPFNLVVEESPIFCPQVGSLSRFQKSSRAALCQYSRVYRNFGAGLTLLTQRAAAIDKNCFGQCSTFVGLRVASKLDRKALLEWSAVNGVDMGKDLDSLAASEPGNAAIWSPVFGGQMGTRFKVALRSTFHPSARDLNGNRAVRLKEISPVRVSVPAHFSWKSIWGGLCGKQKQGSDPVVR